MEDLKLDQLIIVVPTDCSFQLEEKIMICGLENIFK
ncbi:MAG: hypothetical protein ACD_29C00316G0001 [uncultured bacterium]|nr:MAG: hypothetical protein ACD_29C00316G0001 [uncultured bacterium]